MKSLYTLIISIALVGLIGCEKQTDIPIKLQK